MYIILACKEIINSIDKQMIKRLNEDKVGSSQDAPEMRVVAVMKADSKSNFLQTTSKLNTSQTVTTTQSQGTIPKASGGDNLRDKKELTSAMASVTLHDKVESEEHAVSVVRTDSESNLSEAETELNTSQTKIEADPADAEPASLIMSEVRRGKQEAEQAELHFLERRNDDYSQTTLKFGMTWKHLMSLDHDAFSDFLHNQPKEFIHNNLCTFKVIVLARFKYQMQLATEMASRMLADRNAACVSSKQEKEAYMPKDSFGRVEENLYMQVLTAIESASRLLDVVRHATEVVALSRKSEYGEATSEVKLSNLKKFIVELRKNIEKVDENTDSSNMYKLEDSLPCRKGDLKYDIIHIAILYLSDNRIRNIDRISGYCETAVTYFYQAFVSSEDIGEKKCATVVDFIREVRDCQEMEKLPKIVQSFEDRINSLDSNKGSNIHQCIAQINARLHSELFLPTRSRA